MRLYFNILFIVLLSVSAIAPEPACQGLVLYKAAPFPVGAALNTEKLKFEERYWTTALKHFNSFTPEKIMKPSFLHPARDRFDFSELDHLMPFCLEHNVRLHGHTLVWHKSLPQWIEDFQGGSDTFETILNEHIRIIVSHCKTYIRSWDVVNEAFTDDGSLRESIWFRHLGEGYIEKAFRYAAETDPEALLFYNDYALASNGKKLGAVLNHLLKLRGKGVKVDGIGMQMHVSLEYPSNEQIRKASEKIANAGFLVHYSELDISLTEGQPFFASGKKLLSKQKERMRAIVGSFVQLDPAKRFGITMWAVSDGDSWLTADHLRSRPVLFDGRYRAKPAFCGFIQGLNQN